MLLLETIMLFRDSEMLSITQLCEDFHIFTAQFSPYLMIPLLDISKSFSKFAHINVIDGSHKVQNLTLSQTKLKVQSHQIVQTSHGVSLMPRFHLLS